MFPLFWFMTFLSISAGLASCQGRPTPEQNGEQPQNHGGKVEYLVGAYIEEVSLHRSNGKGIIRIEGYLPTPCHQLSPVEQHMHGDTLTLTLSGWQPADAICAQVLHPFTLDYPDPLNRETWPPAIRVHDHLIFP